MKAYTVEKTDKTIIVGFKDPNLTIISPIMKALSDDKDVEMVRFVDRHPELSDRTLYVEVRNGTPEEALGRAYRAVSEYYGTVEE